MDFYKVECDVCHGQTLRSSIGAPLSCADCQSVGWYYKAVFHKVIGELGSRSLAGFTMRVVVGVQGVPFSMKLYAEGDTDETATIIIPSNIPSL